MSWDPVEGEFVDFSESEPGEGDPLVPVEPGERAEIGYRLRVIRCHLGLSPEIVAGLAGISEDHLLQLESGQRRFDRRGLIEDLAKSVGCSVTDLTGQPYLPVDRATADALAVVPGIREALCDMSLDNPLDLPARPVAELTRRTHQAQAHLDQDRFALAGRELGALLSELHVHVTAKDADVRRAALAALVMASHVAGIIVETIGYHDLALAVGRRELDAATRLGDPVMLGLARFGWAWKWINIGARPQAQAANGQALAELEEVADPSATDTGAAELLGMHHLLAATLAARAGQPIDADDHIAEARDLATRLGERNTAMLHFGPTNVALWTLSVDTDLGDGIRGYERVRRAGVDVECLDSRSCIGWYHFDLARALAQYGRAQYGRAQYDRAQYDRAQYDRAQYGRARDHEVVRHLDLADQAAPVRIRNNPIARELTAELTQRARRQLREVDSLLTRFGLAGQGSQPVDD